MSEVKDAVEIEPDVFEGAKPEHHSSAKLPPPPPSIRRRGSASDLRVPKNPSLARDLMTKNILTIGPDDIIAHLEEHMEGLRFRHLPVVEGHKVVGLITRSDLLHASSTFLSDSAKARNELIHRQPAKLIMQRDLVTVRPTDTLLDVAFLMWETRVGCVLVTEEDDTLVGIITEGDFLRLAYHFLRAKGREASSSIGYAAHP
jgi:CBS domain-containing membrane protein